MHMIKPALKRDIFEQKWIILTPLLNKNTIHYYFFIVKCALNAL